MVHMIWSHHTLSSRDFNLANEKLMRFCIWLVKTSEIPTKSNKYKKNSVFKLRQVPGTHNGSHFEKCGCKQKVTLQK